LGETMAEMEATGTEQIRKFYRRGRGVAAG
jgi:hypothetical protein